MKLTKILNLSFVFLITIMFALRANSSEILDIHVSWAKTKKGFIGSIIKINSGDQNSTLRLYRNKKNKPVLYYLNKKSILRAWGSGLHKTTLIINGLKTPVFHSKRKGRYFQASLTESDFAKLKAPPPQEPLSYHLKEFGVYDSNNKKIIKIGALDAPKRLAHLYDNPKKLEGFTDDEKTYIQQQYNWTGDTNAKTVLMIYDLRNHPKWPDKPLPVYPNPFVVVVKNPHTDFVGFQIRTSPSKTRKEAIDKIFSWLTSSSPGIDEDSRLPFYKNPSAKLKKCLEQNKTRLTLTPIKEMISSNTSTADLAKELKTYLNSDDQYSGFYYAKAANLLEKRYNRFNSFTLLYDPKQSTTEYERLYPSIKFAFNYQAFTAIVRNIGNDSDILELISTLAEQENSLYDNHGTISFNFNYTGLIPVIRDERYNWNPKNGPRVDVPYTKHWLLVMLVEYALELGYARDWFAPNIDWFNRVEDEYHYALWRRRPLIDYAIHNKSSTFSLLFSSGYCFPTNDFKAQNNGKTVVETALENPRGWGLASDIATYNNLYNYIGEDLGKVDVLF